MAASSKEKETVGGVFVPPSHRNAAPLLRSRPLSSTLLLSHDNRKSIDRRSFRGGISVALAHRQSSSLRPLLFPPVIGISAVAKEEVYRLVPVDRIAALLGFSPVTIRHHTIRKTR